jgi:hypothetical protein
VIFRPSIQAPPPLLHALPKQRDAHARTALLRLPKREAAAEVLVLEGAKPDWRQNFWSQKPL